MGGAGYDTIEYKKEKRKIERSNLPKNLKRKRLQGLNRVVHALNEHHVTAIADNLSSIQDNLTELD